MKAAQASRAYADAMATYLGLGVDKMTDYNCALATWIIRNQPGHAMSETGITDGLGFH